jgi:release factor glutamine methyltransferase
MTGSAAPEGCRYPGGVVSRKHHHRIESIRRSHGLLDTFDNIIGLEVPDHRPHSARVLLAWRRRRRETPERQAMCRFYDCPVKQAAQTWTTRRLLAWMTEAFAKKGLDSPRLQAELLTAHVIGCERLRLYMDADRPASEVERQRLRDLVGRALAHEPVQYLVGEAWFFSLPFHVDRRPATETIVEHVLQHARVDPGFGGRAGEGVLLADVCTGSGCIAVALLKNLSQARAVATDLAADALEVARQNAARHGVLDRLDLVQGDLLQPLREFPATRGDGQLHYLVSNPPYIPDGEWEAVAPNVKDYEPESALRGGADGLRFVRPLIEEGPLLLRPGGQMLLEVAESTADAACLLMRAHEAIEHAEVLQDFEGRARVVLGRRRR